MAAAEARQRFVAPEPAFIGGVILTDLATEEAHLAKAERDIADGLVRIERQAKLVDYLREKEQDASVAEELLVNIEQTLDLWQDHRDEILRAIDRLTREAGTPTEER